jgi:O-antigen/teichoic acid export membrane protein
MQEPGAGDVRTNEELTAATAAGLRWVTAARVGAEIFLLGAMVVLARLIPPADFGMFAVVVIVQELALSMPAEGIGGALVQRRSIGREHLQGGLTLSLLVAAGLIAATLVLAAVVVAPLFGRETAELVALSTPWFALGAVYAVPIALLRRRLDFRRLSMVDLTSSLSRASVAVILAAVAGLDAAALVIGNLVGMAAALALALAFAPVPLPRWRPRAIRELLPYGGPAALACIAWTGFRNADYAIVGARLGTAQAGFYWRGFQLAVEYQRKISMVMTQMAFPVLARTAGATEMFALRERMVQLLTVVVFPLLVSLVLLAPDVVPWLFGPNWEPAVLPTQILAGAGAATVVIDAVGSVLMAAGRTRALLAYGVAHFAVYATAVLVAAGRGLTAVSIAAVTVHGVFLYIAYRVLLHGRDGRAPALIWHDLRAASLSCVALAAVAAPVQWALRDTGAPAEVHILAVGACGGLAYLAALRTGFPTAWDDLRAAVRRVVPAGAVPAPIRRWMLRAAARPRRARRA